MKQIGSGLFFVLISFLLVLPGCSSKGTSTSSGLGPDGRPLSEIDLDAQRESRFGDGSIPMAEGEGLFRDVRFPYDSSDIPDAARQSIEYNVQILRDNPDINVQLEGHCDERGTSEYNMALGARRAQAVYDVLLSYGLNPQRMSTISYGAEIPLDPRFTEEAWAKNRRVHFSPYRGSLR